MKLHYSLFPDGSFSLSDGSGFTLTDLYPAADGRPLHAVRVETGADYIRYKLAEGEFLLRFFEPEGGLGLDIELNYDVPLENMAALLDAAEKYRHYKG